MKYMLLIYQGSTPTPDDPEGWARLPDDEKRRIPSDYQAVSQTAGVTPGLWMQPPEAATTVRVADGKTLVTDGPYLAVKEALGGYLLYEAADLDSALELAARIPAARLGGAVEVRPIKEY
jgi:hypothetical protein